MGRDGVVITVDKISSGPAGVNLNITIPVTYDAFHDIEVHLRDFCGIDVRAQGGGGNPQVSSSNWKLGPFTTVDEAKRVLEALRQEVCQVYTVERNWLNQFAPLVREYPIDEKIL